MSQANNLTPPQSEDLIFRTLQTSGIPVQLAKLVTAQSGHETGGWQSDVYLNNNNAFGYGYNGTSYKSYPAGVEDSVYEIIGYLNRRVRDGTFPTLDQITTPDQYAQLLKDVGYYEDRESNYAAGIRRWLNDNLDTIGISAGLIIFGVLLFIFFRKG